MSDAAAALAFVRGHRPSVIISDYQMAGMNGLAFLEEVRRQPELRDVATMLITGHRTPAVVEGARRLGAEVVAKPFYFKALVTKVRELAMKDARR